MQDRYAGDLGDYLKFGLLRCLVPSSWPASLRLGVVWYLTADETHNADGKHVSYLSPGHTSSEHLREMDPDLYERLATVVASGQRSTAALAAGGVLGTGTCYFGELLDFTDLPAGQAGRAARQERRRSWTQRALAATSGCDLIFADPDNGIRPARHPVPAHRPPAVNTPISMNWLPSPGEASPSSLTTTPTARRPSSSRHAAGWQISPATCPSNRSLPCEHPAARPGCS